ncbi:MAG: hypothetical protein ACLFPE_05110 [Bacteroidales bacterium]
MSRKNLDKLIYLLALAVNVFLVFVLFSGLNAYETSTFFNSDALYLPSLYKDLIVEGKSLEGWNTAPSILLMPDVVLYFLLRALTGDLIVASFVFGLIQYVGILVLGTLIYRIVFSDLSLATPALMVLLMSTFHLVTVISGWYIFSSFLYLNGYHTGAFLMALICVWLSLKYLCCPRRNLLIILYVLVPLSVASDLLFILMFPLAFGLALLFQFLTGKDQRTGKLLFLTSVSLVAGLLIYWAIRQSGYIHLGRASNVMNPDKVAASFHMLTNQLTSYLLVFDFRSLIILLAAASLVTQLVILIRRMLRKKFSGLKTLWLLFSVLFISGIFSAPVITGSYSGFDSVRYNFAAYVLAMINLGLLLSGAFMSGRLTSDVVRGFSAAMLVAVLYAGITNFSASGLKAFFNYYPELAQVADEVAQRHQLKKGIANFWKAKFITMFSKEGVEVYPVFITGHPYHHLVDEDVFYEETSEFNFIILYGMDDEKRYMERFPEGIPVESGLLKIRLLPDFRFHRNSKMPIYLNAE